MPYVMLTVRVRRRHSLPLLVTYRIMDMCQLRRTLMIACNPPLVIPRRRRDAPKRTEDELAPSVGTDSFYQQEMERYKRTKVEDGGSGPRPLVK